MKPYSFFILWILGFVVLFVFDLFIEGVVFEWLELNGTTKNDWFFKVWWVALMMVILSSNQTTDQVELKHISF